MYSRQELPSDLLRRAARRQGLILARELDEHGISRALRHRMAHDGRLHHLTRGIYSISTPTVAALALAGILVADPRTPRGAAIGGLHALHLAGVDTPLTLAGPITIWIPGPGAPMPRDPWRFRRDGHDRLGRSSPLRRIIDRHDAVLDVTANLEAPRVIGFMLDLLRDGNISAPALAGLLADRKRHRHRRLLSDLMSDAGGGIHSALEHRHMTGVEHPHRLPTPQRQVRVGPSVVDGWYPVEQIAIELDGWSYHKDTVRADARRDNERAGNGIVTLRFGWEDVVGAPCRTAEAIADALQARGWAGRLRPCRACSKAAA